jgi:hypothetical protein
MILHSWDPGVTTGYARFEYDEHTIRVLHTHEFDDDPSTLADWYMRQVEISALADWQAGIFVIEKWRLFAGKAEYQTNQEQMAAVVRGRIEIIAALLGATLMYQNPSDMKAISNQLLLERLGLSELPVGEHRKDALKHGLYNWLRWRDRLRRSVKGSRTSDVRRGY